MLAYSVASGKHSHRVLLKPSLWAQYLVSQHIIFLLRNVTCEAWTEALLAFLKALLKTEREVFCSSVVSVRVRQQPTKLAVFNYQIRANYQCLEVLFEQKCRQTVGERVKLPQCVHPLPSIQEWKWQDSFDLNQFKTTNVRKPYWNQGKCVYVSFAPHQNDFHVSSVWCIWGEMRACSRSCY